MPIRKGMEGPLLGPIEALGMDSTWKGKAAAGGKVSVMAEDSTRFAHAHVRFEVDDGGYATPVSLSEGEKMTDYLWPGVALGKNVSASGDSTAGGVMEGDGAAVDVVATGPNRGYAIVKYAAYSVHRFRRINERLDSAGPKEIPYGDSTAWHWDYLKAKGYDPSRLLAGTWGHEGYGRSFGAKGHQEQIEKALTVEACGDAGAIAARIVAPTAKDARDLRDRTEEIADTAFIMSILHNHVHGNHGASGSAIAYWKPGRSPYVGVHKDPYDSNHERSYSSPGCDWASF